MWKQLFYHWMTTLSGIVGAAAVGAAAPILTTGKVDKQTIIAGAIVGAAGGIAAAAGAAAKDPGKV